VKLGGVQSPAEAKLAAVEISETEYWDDLCQSQSIEPDRPQVFEHWFVRNWAFSKLMEQGETVGIVEDIFVWGRCTTGQAMCLDHVWQSIAAELQILDGQANSWSRSN
jgi:hypothetical protein